MTLKLVSMTRTLNPHKCGSSRIHIRLQTTRKRYDNTWGVLRRPKDFSTFMRGSKEFLRVRRIIKGPMSKIKILSSNHNWKGDCFNKPKTRRQYQIENRHQFPICFKTTSQIMSLWSLMRSSLIGSSTILGNISIYKSIRNSLSLFVVPYKMSCTTCGFNGVFLLLGQLIYYVEDVD